MPRAFTYEEVTSIFEKNGCKLVSKEYANRNDVLKYVCSCGNETETVFALFLQGTRCEHCQSENKSKAHRFDYRYVKQYFADSGCELLEKNYTNTSQKLNYLCSCGNESVITFRKFRQGQRCFKCSGTPKLAYEEVKRRFESLGYKLIDDTYINRKSPMKCICSCGNNTEVSLVNLKPDGVCESCKNAKAPASKLQRYVCDLLNGELNYKVDELHLDVAFPEKSTYLECDFSGHWLTVDYGLKTLEEFTEREASRRRFMNLHGWIEVRLISKSDYLPQDDELVLLVKTILTLARKSSINMSIDLDKDVIINLDNNEIITSIKRGEAVELHIKRYLHSLQY